MKTLFLLATLLTTHAALAEPKTVTRTLKDTTTWIALELNPKTVFCTVKGYGFEQLKISVPDLDWLAHFNHRVEGESLPCVALGRCTHFGNGLDLKPQDIFDPQRPIAIAGIRVILRENLTIDRDAKTCSRVLEEEIGGLIRDHEISHHKHGEAETVLFEKCQKLI